MSANRKFPDNLALRSQDWDQSQKIGRLGEELVRSLFEYLRQSTSWFRTLAVVDLSDRFEFQKLGIDFAWFVEAASSCCAITVEVKADRNSQTGNFFLETVSDIERDIPGAFVASSAEWYFYTFPEVGLVYCIPLPDAKDWFAANMTRYREPTVQTTRSNRAWRTSGRIVPINDILMNVPQVKCFQLTEMTWSQVI